MPDPQEISIPCVFEEDAEEEIWCLRGCKIKLSQLTEGNQINRDNKCQTTRNGAKKMSKTELVLFGMTFLLTVAFLWRA